MDQQQHYVGLDVSLEITSICVIDDKAAVVWRGKCASTPDAITGTVGKYAPAAIRVGLETGQLSNWLWRDGVTGAFGEMAVDMTLRLDNAAALPTYPQPQQQSQLVLIR
jgi:hypothetical protein